MRGLAADLARAVEAEELALGILRFDDTVGDEGEVAAAGGGFVIGDTGGDAEGKASGDFEFAAVGIGAGWPALARVTVPSVSKRAQPQVTKPPPV